MESSYYYNYYVIIQIYMLKLFLNSYIIYIIKLLFKGYQSILYKY